MARFLGFLKLFRKDLLIMLMAMRHPGTPKAIKGMMLAALLYLVSPVDLIPDTIPFLGIVDDAVVLPAAVCGLLQLLPYRVREDSEAQAWRLERRLPYLMVAASIVVLLWTGLVIWAVYSLFFR